MKKKVKTTYWKIKMIVKASFLDKTFFHIVPRRKLYMPQQLLDPFIHYELYIKPSVSFKTYCKNISLHRKYHTINQQKESFLLHGDTNGQYL